MTELLRGKRILVVEDEFLIGAMVMEMLSAAGAVSVGPATSRDAAIELASSERLDGVILDINLRGERSDAVAAELHRRNIPFVLATGYGERDVMLQGVPVLAKPFTEHKLLDGLLLALQRTDTASRAERMMSTQLHAELAAECLRTQGGVRLQRQA